MDHPSNRRPVAAPAVRLSLPRPAWWLPGRASGDVRRCHRSRNSRTRATSHGRLGRSRTARCGLAPRRHAVRRRSDEPRMRPATSSTVKRMADGAGSAMACSSSARTTANSLATVVSAPSICRRRANVEVGDGLGSGISSMDYLSCGSPKCPRFSVHLRPVKCPWWPLSGNGCPVGQPPETDCTGSDQGLWWTLGHTIRTGPPASPDR